MGSTAHIGQRWMVLHIRYGNLPHHSAVAAAIPAARFIRRHTHERRYPDGIEDRGDGEGGTLIGERHYVAGVERNGSPIDFVDCDCGDRRREVGPRYTMPLEDRSRAVQRPQRPGTIVCACTKREGMARYVYVRRWWERRTDRPVFVVSPEDDPLQ